MNLRPYQSDCIQAIYREWDHHASTLAVLATGLGKTVIASHVLDQLPHGRAMMIAHREELVWQAANKIKAVTGDEPAIEMADYWARSTMFGPSRFVVSSVQTLNAGRKSRRIEQFDPDDFSCLIIDECHHATANSYRRVIDHFRQNDKLRILGITATPNRADDAAMGMVFESAAYTFDIADAIPEGWLVPIEQHFVPVDGLDLSNVRTTAGDLNGADLNEQLEAERNLHEFAHPTYEIANGRTTLVFAASVKQAERLTEILNRHEPGCAEWVSGETPKEDRRKMFAAYADRRFQFLVNVGVATEGFDAPFVQVIAVARPTKSTPLYTQIVGRGTRPLPGIVDNYEDPQDRRKHIELSAKPFVEIIDFVGNSGRHKLVTTADVLGGKYDDAVRDRAIKKAKELDDSADMGRLLEEAKQELYEEEQRRKRQEAAKRARLVAKANYSKQRVDPFDVFGIAPVRETSNSEWLTARPLSDRQLDILHKQGIETDGLSPREQRRLLNEVFSRWDNNQCSYKQAKLLNRYGLPGDVGREQAKQWIDQIAANGWRCPPGLGQPAGEEIVVY